MRLWGTRWIAGACVAAGLAIAAADPPLYSQPQFRVETVERGLPPMRQFSPTQVAALETLNRADVEHLEHLTVLVVPESWPLDEHVPTVLPTSYDAARPYRKLIVVYVPGQIFGAYESGRLVRWGPVSTGNFQNDSGLAFHEYALPGHPASHGCVRLLGRDAQWLFEWGEPWTLDHLGQRVLGEGTPVLTTGVYDFESPPPWRSVAWLAAPIDLPALLPPPEGQNSGR
jgi:hypothetical protein